MKWLERLGMAGIARNLHGWLDMLRINWKWLDLARVGWNLIGIAGDLLGAVGSQRILSGRFGWN